MKRFTSTLALFLLLAAPAVGQQIIYVDANGSEGGTHDGTSWSTAFFSLQEALGAAVSGDQIWVANGLYAPISTYSLPAEETQNAHFEMKNGVEIYGGFEGTETAVSQRTNYRRGEANETFLSGDIGTWEDNSDNCFHVIYNPESLALDNTAVLDGFTITGGNATEIESQNFGDAGGGMFNDNGSPIVRNCAFINNIAFFGGGMYNDGPGSPTVINCIFSGNTALQVGGGIYNGDSLWFSAVNCLFQQNSAMAFGGGMVNQTDLLTIINCTFYNNAAPDGGAMGNNFSFNPLTSIKNSIFWENHTGGETPDVSEIASISTSNFTYCCIRGENSGTYSGTGNIFVDPLFTGVGEGGAPVLGDESPCIGAGTATDAPLTDILGITRGTPPDMGAYENILNTPLPVELTSFTATVSNAIATLRWQTATEINNHGFAVERKTIENGKLTIENWKQVGFVEGSGTTNSPKSYSFVDGTAKGKVIYRLKQIDNDGKFEYSSEIEVTAGQTPQKFALMQNYPNPFNPSTEIRYQMPDAGMVSLKIYDMVGREVQTLVNEVKEAGEHRAEFTASHLASGIYFYTLQTNNFTATKKMLMVK